jgi:hypothetical protein
MSTKRKAAPDGSGNPYNIGMCNGKDNTLCRENKPSIPFHGYFPCMFIYPHMRKIIMLRYTKDGDPETHKIKIRRNKYPITEIVCISVYKVDYVAVYGAPINDNLREYCESKGVKICRK